MEQMYDNYDPMKIKIALLAGGNSNERSISLKSAEGAKAALEEAGFQVTQLDPADKEDLIQLIENDFDCAFLVLHGKGGEDGVIQGFLETIGIPYTGSGIWASSTAIDKSKTKNIYRENGVPTAASVILFKGMVLDIPDIVSKLSQKCVVKAATEGSSIGVYIVEGEEALKAAIDDAFEIDDTLVIEQYVKGREFTAPVIDTKTGSIALPLIEIIPKAESYDFESKYMPGGSEHICPAVLDEQTTKKMQDLSIRAHKALGCKGVSRTDFIMEDDGSMWALETNTLPGMTATSLLPEAAKAAGITFPELCKILVQNALED